MDPVTTIWRSAIAFFVLLFLARLQGAKQVAQLTFFNYVTGIAIGSMAAIAALEERVSVVSAVTALAVWTALSIGADYASLKNMTARALLEDEPLVLIHNGKVLDRNMAKVRYNHSELLAHLRNSGVFSPSQVAFAVLETDGRLSILKKPQFQPATKLDVQASGGAPEDTLQTEFVVDGQVLDENLEAMGKDLDWLMARLRAQKVTDPSQVALAVMEPDGKLFVDLKDPGRKPRTTH
jgi:uncharacterized membrane protein YcaP (DUF421 family)